MSIEIMSYIWKYGPQNQSETIVLLALADYANEDGKCWPSIEGLQQKSRLSDRGVQKILRRLEEQGWLEIEYGNGRKNCNIYTIKTPNLSAETPNEVPPERGSPPPETPNLSAETPNLSAKNPERGSPEPSITINKPSVSNKRARVVSVLSQWCSVEAAESFVDYRNKHKAKGLTETAAKRLAASLQKIFNAGHDTDDALGMAEERGWASINLEWYENAKGVNHGQRNSGRKHSGVGNESATEQIARLTGLSQA